MGGAGDSPAPVGGSPTGRNELAYKEQRGDEFGASPSFRTAGRRTSQAGRLCHPGRNHGNELDWAAFKDSTVHGAGWTMMQYSRFRDPPARMAAGRGARMAAQAKRNVRATS